MQYTNKTDNSGELLSARKPAGRNALQTGDLNDFGRNTCDDFRQSRKGRDEISDTDLPELQRTNYKGRNHDEIDALPDGALITRAELAHYAGTTVSTLAKWAGASRGPAFVSLGHRGWVRYRMGDVRNWLSVNRFETD